MEILSRLLSLKNNALQRAYDSAQAGQGCDQYDRIKAAILEQGIKQLIMEIQNAIFAEQQITRSGMTAQIHTPAKAS